MKKKPGRTVLILILGMLSAIGPFSIDMYLPGFPAIAEDLGTSVDRVSYSLSSFFIGVCIGQIICGPLLDRYGRKAPLYAGLFIYLAATIGCAFAPTVEVLIGLRFLQALGGCVGMVAPRAVVRDSFPVEENAQVFSLLVLVLGVSPIIAPTAGSYFIAGFGWPSVFIVLTVVAALILLAVFLYLPETKAPDPGFSLRPGPIISSYARVMKQPQFFTYALSGAISSASLFAYISGSPSLFMERYGVTEQQYGWIFALIAAGLITSSQVNSVLLRRYKSEQILPVSMVIQTLLGISLLVLSRTGTLELYSTISLIFLFLCCQGFAFPNSSALSMAPFTREAGSASALMGALQMGFGALASALVGYLYNATTLPMTGVMAGCVVISLLILLLGQWKIRYAARQGAAEEQAFDLVEKF
jgi:DHA1 family bicyclomycin/chloramphenicol resistance-like MFS transporter